MAYSDFCSSGLAGTSCGGALRPFFRDGAGGFLFSMFVVQGDWLFVQYSIHYLFGGVPDLFRMLLLEVQKQRTHKLIRQLAGSVVKAVNASSVFDLR
jgi:hypothetical protein